MVRNRIFYGEIRSMEKDGNTPEYPCTINFMFTKFSSLMPGSSFIYCQKASIYLLLGTLFFVNGPFLCYIFYFPFDV